MNTSANKEYLCSDCGAKNDTLTLAQRDWHCDGCGAKNDRDERGEEYQRCAKLWRESAWRARKTGDFAGDAR